MTTLIQFAVPWIVSPLTLTYESCVSCWYPWYIKGQTWFLSSVNIKSQTQHAYFQPEWYLMPDVQIWTCIHVLELKRPILDSLRQTKGNHSHVNVKIRITSLFFSSVLVCPQQNPCELELWAPWCTTVWRRSLRIWDPVILVVKGRGDWDTAWMAKRVNEQY